MDYLEIAKRTMNFMQPQKEKGTGRHLLVSLRMQPKEDLSLCDRDLHCVQALPGSCVFFWDFTM